MNVQEVLAYGRDVMRYKIISYDIDAKLMLMDILKMSKIEILTSRDEVSEEDLEKYKIYLDRRMENEPVAYIIGKIYFMGYEFNVNKNVLIPRGDTEILIEKAAGYINHQNYSKMLDIGTGSGCIPISLALETAIYCTGVDISDDAIELATENSKKLKVYDRVNFIKSDLFENIDETFDLITSNPPYINKEEMGELMDDVKDYEPHLALYGGEDGLDFYRKITPKAYELLNDEGMLIYEIGYNQGIEVRELMKNAGFRHLRILKDLQGHNRVVYGLK